jgi:5-methylcytosine-specific restriction enzyme subunit McrC
MNAKGKHIITTYEHQRLKLGETINFEQKHLLALQRYYGEKGTCFFSLIHNGVKFNQFVGVIQVDALVIEVLPKTDQTGDECHWRKLLIGMLRAVKSLNVHTSGSTDLKLKSNSILDLYLEVFITEVEQLLYKGLIKQYRRREGNSLALKGKLVFTKHIQQNLIHQEQFYVNHQTYDRENTFNQIIYKALLLVKGINTSTSLQSRIGSLLLYFPEMNDLYVTEETFSLLQFNRKTEPYREAINIARLLLLNYHPDVSRGNSHVMTLMFDMNSLWESFVLHSLKKFAPDQYLIKGKIKKTFWEADTSLKVGMEPDIVIECEDQTFILDTKWKVLNGNRPSDDDLKQMYVYTKYFDSSYTALVYPYDSIDTIKGAFWNERDKTKNYPCSLIKLKLPLVMSNFTAWQKDICTELLTHLRS